MKAPRPVNMMQSEPQKGSQCHCQAYLLLSAGKFQNNSLDCLNTDEFFLFFSLL